MNGATTIQERLKDLRLNKGLKLEELAEQTGISKSALGSYEKDDYKEINHGNLILLADFYGVSLDYLFCRTENRAEINTPLRELHLSDEMVALLKSSRINNRLLCELATHKDFIKFLADIEIYVDGIATMQIQNLNALVDTVRHEIIERYRPGEDARTIVLSSSHFISGSCDQISEFSPNFEIKYTDEFINSVCPIAISCIPASVKSSPSCRATFSSPISLAIARRFSNSFSP